MTQTLDAGEANHSPSAEFMTLVDVDHQNDFNAVVEYVKSNLDKIISEVHGFDKLLIDNGKTQMNCPPAPEGGDTHGGLLIKTLSEAEGAFGITLKREFKIHDLGRGGGDEEGGTNTHRIEIREDVVKAPAEEGQQPIMSENSVVVEIVRP
jgi:hypothetical protein